MKKYEYLGVILCALVGVSSTTACSSEPVGTTTSATTPPARDQKAPTEADFTQARNSLVDKHILPSGVKDAKVLEVMRKVPRHRFVPPVVALMAYEDGPLPIGHEQTISQPSLVAYMTEALQLKPTDRVLEIGTGSGYQAAILSHLAKDVYSIEIVEPLAKASQKVLKELGHKNIQVRSGDGYRGWPDKAPFDAIILTAAPGNIPQPLIDQLADGGRLLAPVGGKDQKLVLLTKTAKGIKRETLIPVIFVPMTGEAQK